MAAGDRQLRDLLGVQGRSRLLERLEQHLDFARWGFELTYVEPIYGPVIFDSPRCRVLFDLSMEQGGDEISVGYGRRHAPNDRSILEWNGEKCFAWHNLWILNVTEYLEGFSAPQVVERRGKKIDTPERIAFRSSELSRSLRGAEGRVALEAFIWDMYGERLFSLFDVREPERWEELRRFVKEYYELRPELSTAPAFGIPEWQIC